MPTTMKRGLVAGASVIVATAIGVITNIATNQDGLAWWVSLGALLIIGAGAQVWLTSTDRKSDSITAAGAGSVAVGGSTHGTIRTRTNISSQQSSSPVSSDGLLASGPGSIAIGGEAKGDLSTEVEG